MAAYGSSEARYKVALNNWLVSNPDKTVSIYEVAGSVNPAYRESFSSYNICRRNRSKLIEKKEKTYKEKAKKRKTNKGSEKAKVSAKKTKKNIKSPKVPRNDNDSDTDISSEISLHDESPTPANLEEFYDEMVQENKDDSVCPICQGEYQNTKESGSSVNFARNGLTTLVGLWES
ncbi:hypothetical protein JTB14_020227 [Gonioctena quinquepunctata]|nr:hypothetical protein JTB14_020227 [Gonioctena quinquepunctata]